MADNGDDIDLYGDDFGDEQFGDQVCDRTFVFLTKSSLAILNVKTCQKLTNFFFISGVVVVVWHPRKRLQFLSVKAAVNPVLVKKDIEMTTVRRTFQRDIMYATCFFAFCLYSCHILVA